MADKSQTPGRETPSTTAVTGAPARPDLIDEQSKKRASLEFAALRNAIAHSMRQRWFDALHRWLMFLIVLTGTAGATKIADRYLGDLAFGGVVALLASLDLVLNLGSKAAIHNDLKRQYYRLLATIRETAPSDASQLGIWDAELMRLSAEEPDLFRVVDCQAYNVALFSLGRNQEKVLVMPLWRRLLGQVLSFQSYNPPTQDEIATHKKAGTASHRASKRGGA